MQPQDPTTVRAIVRFLTNPQHAGVVSTTWVNFPDGRMANLLAAFADETGLHHIHTTDRLKGLLGSLGFMPKEGGRVWFNPDTAWFASGFHDFGIKLSKLAASNPMYGNGNPEQFVMPDAPGHVVVDVNEATENSFWSRNNIVLVLLSIGAKSLGTDNGRGETWQLPIPTQE